DLLSPLLILEADLVKIRPSSAGARPRLDAALGLVGRKIPRRHLLRVVDATDDDRLVGIAFQEIRDHFLADPGDGGQAPVLAGPHGADADPARAVGVVLAGAVPVELDLHAAVLVGEDLLAARSDDHGRLTALDGRPRSDSLRTERNGRGDAAELVPVVER